MKTRTKTKCTMAASFMAALLVTAAAPLPSHAGGDPVDCERQFLPRVVPSILSPEKLDIALLTVPGTRLDLKVPNVGHVSDVADNFGRLVLDLSELKLAHDTAIPYILDASHGERNCNTADVDLALFVTERHIKQFETFSNPILLSQRRELERATFAAGIWSLHHAGLDLRRGEPTSLPVSTTCNDLPEEMHPMCESLTLDEPQDHPDPDSVPPVPPTSQVAIPELGAVADAILVQTLDDILKNPTPRAMLEAFLGFKHCKTIRFRSDKHEDEPYYARFGFDKYEYSNAWGEATANARAHWGSGHNSIDLRSYVTQHQLGEPRAWAQGVVGFAFKTGLSETGEEAYDLTIVPHIRWSLRGDAEAAVSAVAPLSPGHAEASSDIILSVYSMNQARNTGWQDGGTRFNETVRASASVHGQDKNGELSDEGGRVQLPILGMSPGEAIYAVAYAVVDSRADVLGLGRSAHSWTVFETDPWKQLNFYVQADYADFTIIDADWYWWSERCL